jgi:hypothetical protein
VQNSQGCSNSGFTLILELNIPFNVGFIFELGKLRALAN